VRIGLPATLTISLCFPVFGQVEVTKPTPTSTNNCGQDGIAPMSPSQTKARLRHMSPISSPLLYRSMRITDAVLSFNVGTDLDGNVVCVQAISGHPILIGAAIESLKTWKFRPPKVHHQHRTLMGTLILRVSGTEHGLKTLVLSAEPQKNL
jgi:hypothetical protein